MTRFTFRSALPSDIDILVELEKRVESGLPCREMFAIDGPEFYEPIVAGAGHILLAFDEKNALAGVSVVRYPAADDPENLGLELGFRRTDLLRVRHAESIFIRPDCGGHGLASQLLHKNLGITDSCERDLVLATIWPNNYASLKLHLACGFQIRAFALKYGGKPRFVLLKERGERRLSKALDYVPATDFEAHKKILASGMIGTICRKDDSGSIWIGYRRSLPA